MGDLTDADIDFFDADIEKLRPRVALRAPSVGPVGGGRSASSSSSAFRSLRATSVAPASFKHFDDLDEESESLAGFGSRARRARSEARDLLKSAGGGGRDYDYDYGGYGGSGYGASDYGYGASKRSSQYSRSYLSSNYSRTLPSDPFELDTLLPSYRTRKGLGGFGGGSSSFGFGGTSRNFSSKPSFTDFVGDRQSSGFNYKSRSGLSSSASKKYDYDYGFDSDSSNLAKFSKGFGRRGSAAGAGGKVGGAANSAFNSMKHTAALESYVNTPASSDFSGVTTLGARFDKYADRLVRNYFDRYYGGEKKFYQKRGKKDPRFAHLWI